VDVGFAQPDNGRKPSTLKLENHLLIEEKKSQPFLARFLHFIPSEAISIDYLFYPHSTLSISRSDPLFLPELPFACGYFCLFGIDF
jgi:hypothetical protein